MKSQEAEEICNALQHDLRREILRRIDQAEDPLSAKDLAIPLGLPLSQIGYHLNVLADCELVTSARDRQRRGTLHHQHYAVGPKVKENATIMAMLGPEPPSGASDEAREPVVFGYRVRRLREAKGLSRQGLAERVGLDVDQLQDVELGLSSPLMKTLVALAGALEVELGEIVAGLSP